jgi:hypothetical protein
MRPLARPVDHDERRRRGTSLLLNPQFVEPDRSYRPRLGKVCAAIALILSLGSNLFTSLFEDLIRPFEPLIVRGITSVVLWVVLIVAIIDLTRRSCTALHLIALDAVLESGEPPVLYLRPFLLDDRKGSVRLGFWPTLTFSWSHIFKELKRIGPVIEIEKSAFSTSRFRSTQGVAGVWR